MIISEIFKPMPDGYSTEKEDNSAVKLSDVRKTRLSLAQINRLRVMNDVRKFEHEQKLTTISKQYKPAEEAAVPGL